MSIGSILHNVKSWIEGEPNPEIVAKIHDITAERLRKEARDAEDRVNRDRRA
jgi:hypothetical protein